MTSILDRQALTRRERRETEEHRHEALSAPAPQAPALIVPSAPFSTLVMEPEPGPAVAPQVAAPARYPLTHPVAPPAPDQPSARSDRAPFLAPGHSTPADAQPLSRRERKLLEQPSFGAHGLGHSSPAGLPTSAPVSAPTSAPAVTHQPAPPVYAPTVYAPPAAQSYPAPPAPQAPQSSPAPPAPQAPQEPTVSRGIGHTTGPSSLILLHSPSLDLAGPLGNNGEIIVTGQIRISPQVVERGTAPFQYVSKDEDDSEIVYSTVEDDAMVKPVPASHAVASKSNNAELALMRSTRWGTGAVVNVLSISVFAVVAVTLLVLSLTTGVLL